MTIHRMLGFDPATGGFQHHAGKRLPFDAVLVDESSMVDVLLMRSVLVALRDDCRLVLVGDADQLPPVGPGAPFRDMVGSETLPLARLTQVHRQAQGSRIVGASREVMGGKLPTASSAGDRSEGALFVVEDSTAERVVELVRDDIPTEFQIASSEVQVVAPMRNGSLGVDALNVALQSALNERPAEERYAYKHGDRELEFRVGDRVMQTKNDYRKGVVNGEIGTVSAMLDHAENDRKAPVLSVRFPDGGDDKIVEY
jgi:exodeoxyribonuclease V alpha subunit